MALINPESNEWKTLRTSLLVEESKQPEQWWYLSFADEQTGFKGMVFVEASGVATAIMLADEMELNPGGHILAQPFPGEPPNSVRYRLLPKSDVEQYFGAAVMEGDFDPKKSRQETLERIAKDRVIL